MENRISTKRMDEYKTLELSVHATIDDAMHKVIQEVWEMLEAEMSGNISETQKEAWDVIVNVLSVATELWCNLDIHRSVSEKKTPAELIMILWDWNWKIQSFRNRYSREQVSLEDLSDITSDFIMEILKYADPEKDINDILLANIEKFEARVTAYKPDINVWDYIDTYKNFPIEGIEFKDISPILRNAEAFRYVCFELANACSWADVIAWLDARGFLFGPKVAEILWIPFEMIRKKGKLPGECIGTWYDLEYGSNNIEVQKWAIIAGQKVAVLDDLLATGGTAWAAIKLVEMLWAEVMQVAFVIALNEKELVNLSSRETLSDYSLSDVISYD